MKVWIVIHNNQGEYEDYDEEIDAVFNTKEKADQFTKNMGYVDEEWVIKEYEVS